MPRGEDHTCHAGDRFEKIEDILQRQDLKLDKIADLLIQNAHLEEKMAVVRVAIDDHETRIRCLETDTFRNTFITGFGAKLWWLGAGGGLSALAWVLLEKLNS